MNIPGIGPASPFGGIGMAPGGGILILLLLLLLLLPVLLVIEAGILALLPPRGGAPVSWLTETTSSPLRTIIPSVRRSDWFRWRRSLNSSQSARTKLRCLSWARSWPMKTRPSCRVTLTRLFNNWPILLVRILKGLCVSGGGGLD